MPQLTRSTSNHRVILNLNRCRYSDFGLWISDCFESAIRNPKSAIASPTRRLDLDINARRKAQFVERFDRFGGRLNDID